MNHVSELGSIEKRTLFAGTEIPALTTKVTILAGQGVLKPGAVIGIITTEGADAGKGKLCDKEAVDGSQKANVILSEEIDATLADVAAVAYKTGIFNYDALQVAAGDTVAAHQDELRDLGIYYRTEH